MGGSLEVGGTEVARHDTKVAVEAPINVVR
jgi:hypothetical protein